MSKMFYINVILYIIRFIKRYKIHFLVSYKTILSKLLINKSAHNYNASNYCSNQSFSYKQARNVFNKNFTSKQNLSIVKSL